MPPGALKISKNPFTCTPPLSRRSHYKPNGRNLYRHLSYYLRMLWFMRISTCDDVCWGPTDCYHEYVICGLYIAMRTLRFQTTLVEFETNQPCPEKCVPNSNTDYCATTRGIFDAIVAGGVIVALAFIATLIGGVLCGLGFCCAGCCCYAICNPSKREQPSNYQPQV